MDDNLLETLKTIDPALLTDVVRHAQNAPSLEITDWAVTRLSDKGIANPDGLWLFRGQGAAGEEAQSWSIVLKVLEQQDEETPPDHLWYWKREFLLAQSDLAADLPVKAPVFYHAEETTDGAWIWMEHVEDLCPGSWSMDTFSFAAHQLGRWNGLYSNGSPLPEAEWLTRQPYRAWLGRVNVAEDWDFPLNQKHISRNLRERYERLWNEREDFFHALESLPQVFSHFDSQRRNLLIRRGKGTGQELVALDWAQCGLGAIGAELSWLVGMSALLLEWSPSDLRRLSDAAFQSYAQGLQQAGWSADISAARLGYLSMMAVYIGCAFPRLTRIWCSADMKGFALQILGSAEEELFWKLLPILDFSLGCAEEARRLMSKLF
jgi:hypothetical protein